MYFNTPTQLGFFFGHWNSHHIFQQIITNKEEVNELCLLFFLSPLSVSCLSRRRKQKRSGFRGWLLFDKKGWWAVRWPERTAVTIAYQFSMNAKKSYHQIVLFFFFEGILILGMSCTENKYFIWINKNVLSSIFLLNLLLGDLYRWATCRRWEGYQSSVIFIFCTEFLWGAKNLTAQGDLILYLPIKKIYITM